MCVCYLRGQDGGRHLVTEVGLGGDLGLGAASALCYAAAAHHGVYILREDTKTQTTCNKRRLSERHAQGQTVNQVFLWPTNNKNVRHLCTIKKTVSNYGVYASRFSFS